MISRVDADSQPLIRLEKAGRTFRMGEVEVPALMDADLDIRRGELLVIFGPSGSGKTTLLNLIGGMDHPTAGRIWHAGTELTHADDETLTAYRRETVGYVFQFYNLVPTLTALENVQVATEIAADPIAPRAALESVGLGQRADHFPAQLSGGEQQRVAIARALAKRPELLLADEPTGALDLESARSVLATLQNLSRSKHLTVVLITHNPAIATIAERLVRLASGQISDVQINENPQDARKVSW